MDGCIKLESVMCFARGKAYFMLQNFEKARECYQEALSVDVKCYGAWDALIKNNMMDEKAELEFFMTSPFDQCDVDEYFFKHLYSLKLKKNNFDGTNMKANLENIENTLDVQLSIAQGYLDACKYEDCLKICEEKFRYRCLL
jgi:anaphase-promoting complex subunit 6